MFLAESYVLWFPAAFVCFWSADVYGPGLFLRALLRISRQNLALAGGLSVVPVCLAIAFSNFGWKGGATAASIEFLIAFDNYLNGRGGSRRRGKKSPASEIKEWVLEAIERTKNWKPVGQPASRAPV